MRYSRLASAFVLSMMSFSAMAGAANAMTTAPSCDNDCMTSTQKHCHCPHDASVYAVQNPDQVTVTDTHVIIDSDTITVSKVSPDQTLNVSDRTVPPFIKDRTQDLNEWSYQHHLDQ